MSSAGHPVQQWGLQLSQCVCFYCPAWEHWIIDHNCAPSPLAERKQAYLSLNWLIGSNIRESTASFLWLMLRQWYLTLMEEPASLSAGLGERMNGDWHPQRGAAAG